MPIDINRLSNQLASDKTISDYDFWRATKTINHALYIIKRQGLPIPMEVIHAKNDHRQGKNEAES